MTLDQLAYILQRKYKNIAIGSDAIIVCSTEKSADGRQFIHLPDARITQWNITYVAQPSDSELNILWERLQEQYHSDPLRRDSEITQFLEPKEPIKTVL